MNHDRPVRKLRPHRTGSRASAPGIERFEARQLLATFFVLNTADDDFFTLRRAIQDANAAPGQDSIVFNIPGPGPHTIRPQSGLLAITDSVIIDATTQPGYSGTPLIELDGSLEFGPATVRDGLRVNAPNTTVRGLAINRFNRFGIVVEGASGVTVTGNFIGTDPSGTLALGNRSGGILVTNATNVAIGGRTPADRNLISGNGGDGIQFFSFTGAPTGNTLLGNLIGTDINGSRALPNTGDGVFIDSTANVVGGVGPGEANTIAFNGFAGVRVGFSNFESGVTSNPIRGNSIFANNALGIDLGSFGVTFNGSGGTGFGPNRLQPFPTVDSAFPSGSGTTVEGQLIGPANSSFALDFYANDVADPTGFGEGQRYLGSAQVTTRPDGVANFTANLAANVLPGQLITATATDRDNNTSEFSLATSVTPTRLADLSVNLFASPDPAQVGEDLTYFVDVINNGPSRATNVTLTGFVPPGTTFVSANPSQGGTFAVAGGVVTASFGELRSGEIGSLRITVRPTAEGTVTQTINARSDQVDPDTRNNTATANTTVNPANPADLGVNSFVSSQRVVVGQDLIYTVVVTNNGPSDRAAGVILTDTLPENATFISSAASQGVVLVSGNTLTADIGTLARGANATIVITVRPNAPGRFTNVATARGAQVDPNGLNNTSTIVTTVAAPDADLSVSGVVFPGTALAGQPLTYTITVANSGPSDATGVILTDLLDSGATLVSVIASQGTVVAANGVITASLGTLLLGQVALVTIVVQPSTIGTITNTATVRGDQADFVSGNNSVTIASQAIEDATLPVILSQRLIVVGRGITAVVLTFSEALDPVQAETLNNYNIRSSGANGQSAGSGRRAIALTSANYDPRRRTVTLTLARPLAVGRFYQLTANGEGASGLTDAGGTLLDGDRNGLPDGIYQAQIGRGTKTRPASFQRGQLVPIPPAPGRRTPGGPARRPRRTTPAVRADISLDLTLVQQGVREG